MAATIALLAMVPTMTIAFNSASIHRISITRPRQLVGSFGSCPQTRHRTPTRSIPVLGAAGLGIGEEEIKEIGIKMPLDLVEQRLEADRVLNRATEDGKLNLKEVEMEQQLEAKALQDKLDDAIAKAMKGAEVELLENYDKQTQGILEKMKAERDIIREEAANIIKLKDDLNSGGLWWNKRGGDSPPKKSSFALTVANFLAWTFAFAAANELWSAQNSEAGITTLVAGKATFDLVIAVVSAFIAAKRSKPEA